MKQFQPLISCNIGSNHPQRKWFRNLIPLFSRWKEELLKVISEDAINHIENQLQEIKIIIESLPIEDVLEVIYQEINHIFTKYFEEIS